MLSTKEYKVFLNKESKKAVSKLQFIKAASLIYKSITAPPQTLQATHYLTLFKLYKESWSFQKRREILSEGLKVEPENLQLNLEMAELNAIDKDWRDAEAALRFVHEEDSSIMVMKDYRRYIISLIKNGNSDEAEEVLQQLSEKNRNDEDILFASGQLYMAKQEWKRALSYLEKLNSNSEIGLSLQTKVSLGKAYRMTGNLEAAEMLLEYAVESGGEDTALWMELAETRFEKKEWKKSIDAYKKVMEGDGDIDANIYSRKRLAEVKLGDLKAAKATLTEGLEKYPKNKTLINALAKVEIAAKNWNEAIEQLLYLKSEFKGETRQKALVDLVMLYKHIGEAQKAESNLAEFFERNNSHPIKSYKEGYRIITLFDNGDCRIDYHKKLTPAGALCITFDTINNTWNDEPFAYRFLKKQDVDIVTVTKRKRPDRYQDLSLEEFYEAVHKLAGTYERVITYGSSIGGYSALYYGSSINAQAIAMAPRNSGHPVFGKNQVEGEFQHLLHPPVNNRITPYIIYDPNNILDNKYVEESLSKTYPNARFIKCYHAGHNCVSHFLDIGILKDFIVNIIKDESVPDYRHSEMKGRSRQYLRVLGTACLNHNKPRWALDISNKAFELFPDDIAINIFRIRAVKAAEGMMQAIEASKEAIGRIKNHQKIKLNLIDLYMQAGDFENAERMIEDGMNTYKNPKEFIKKKKKYSKHFAKQFA
ncbi:tetratricopeptide repeat protein [Planococcus sp. MERTA32b]|nr:tetratricopeptide repeat protein [Planococcus sp. MER TA 32b]